MVYVCVFVYCHCRSPSMIQRVKGKKTWESSGATIVTNVFTIRISLPSLVYIHAESTIEPRHTHAHINNKSKRNLQIKQPNSLSFHRQKKISRVSKFSKYQVLGTLHVYSKIDEKLVRLNSRRTSESEKCETRIIWYPLFDDSCCATSVIQANHFTNIFARDFLFANLFLAFLALKSYFEKKIRPNKRLHTSYDSKRVYVFKFWIIFYFFRTYFFSAVSGT